MFFFYSDLLVLPASTATGRLRLLLYVSNNFNEQDIQSDRLIERQAFIKYHCHLSSTYQNNFIPFLWPHFLSLVIFSRLFFRQVDFSSASSSDDFLFGEFFSPFCPQLLKRSGLSFSLSFSLGSKDSRLVEKKIPELAPKLLE